MKTLIASAAIVALSATASLAGSAFGSLSGGMGGASSFSTSGTVSGSSSFGNGPGGSAASEAGAMHFSGTMGTFDTNSATFETISEGATYSNSDSQHSGFSAGGALDSGSAWGAGGFIGGEANWGF